MNKVNKLYYGLAILIFGTTANTFGMDWARSAVRSAMKPERLTRLPRFVAASTSEGATENSSEEEQNFTEAERVFITNFAPSYEAMRLAKAKKQIKRAHARKEQRGSSFWWHAGSFVTSALVCSELSDLAGAVAATYVPDQGNAQATHATRAVVAQNVARATNLVCQGATAFFITAKATSRDIENAVDQAEINRLADEINTAESGEQTQ